ncbi:MAG: protease SohB, partial [Thiohalomonadales bacterium]
MVHAYGLAASQLQRIRSRNIPLTIAVDSVAASGGYMMACVANYIIAAPFAIIGSIGVIAQVPNFNKLLKKFDIDYNEFTAGEYKRTVTIMGENSEQDKAKFTEQIEDTHLLFKEFISQNRPSVDIAKVSTGEHWFGTRALENKLVDELKTSDDYLLEKSEHADLFAIKYKKKRNMLEKFSRQTQKLIDQVRFS